LKHSSPADRANGFPDWLIECQQTVSRCQTISVHTGMKINMAERMEDEVFSRNLQESLQELEELGSFGLIKDYCNIHLII